MDPKDKNLEQVGAPVNVIHAEICVGLPKGSEEMWHEMIPPPKDKLTIR